MIERGRLTLGCDSCGERLRTELEDAVELRTFAAVKGWQYRTYRIPNPDLHLLSAARGVRRPKTVKRTWDGCPSCPAPETGADLLTSRQKQR